MTCTVDPDGAAGRARGAHRAPASRTLTSTPPTLEELFLDAYRTDAGPAPMSAP